MWTNPKVALGLIGLAAAVGLFVARPWVTSGAELPKPPGQTAKTVAVAAPWRPPVETISPEPKQAARVVRVLGVAGYEDAQGQRVWRYLLESGELLTASQITGRYGLKVREVPEGGVMRLIGEGVTYGPGGD